MPQRMHLVTLGPLVFFPFGRYDLSQKWESQSLGPAWSRQSRAAGNRFAFSPGELRAGGPLGPPDRLPFRRAGLRADSMPGMRSF